ncbi:MAG TPA: hypothetical protein VMT76_18585 [Puia sp.]|nr:hypothetical protein [Puia sp.]
MDTTNIEEYISKISYLKKQGFGFDQIYNDLKKHHISDEVINTAIAEWKKSNTSRKRNLGFIYCGAGTCLLVLSFLLSVMLFYSEHNISWALYGFTFIGLCLTFKGMITIFGW